jgi:2-keto-3-deoxy-L-fuconate dehydrogenase
MAGRLAGKTAFITAAAQGMGQAAALAFAREGARVWATDMNAQALKSIDGKEGIRTRVLDVTDEAAIARVAQEVGDIDVLFNCAGIVHNGSILEATVKDWDQAFAVNVRSMFLVTRAFLPGMLKKQNGSIINMSSVASAIRGLPNRCVYGASKAAVLGLTKSVAADYVRQGIRCNAVAPGTIDTPSLQGRINSYADPVQARKDFVARQPMGRLGTVDDMVPIFIYLASDESRFATGNVFSIDGGMTI